MIDLSDEDDDELDGFIWIAITIILLVLGLCVITWHSYHKQFGPIQVQSLAMIHLVQSQA